MKTDKTTITQELDAIIRASSKAVKALEELDAEYKTHAKRGDNALSFMADAKRYKDQLTAHGNS